MRKVILDHVEGWEVSEDDFFNEIRALEALRAGLLEITVSVWHAEEPIRQRERAEGAQISFYGNAPDLDPWMRQLLPCFFHWYGVSVCNYARLVGYVKSVEAEHVSKELLQQGNQREFERVRKACDHYVNSLPELQEVRTWRNKVAAHFAITSPHRKDDPMTLEASVIYPVTYSGGRFRVSELALARAYEDGTKQESDLPEWSLTKTQENLSERYWRDFQYPSS